MYYTAAVLSMGILHGNHLHVSALELTVELVLSDIQTLEVSRPSVRRQIIAAIFLADHAVSFVLFHRCRCSRMRVWNR